MNQPNIIYFKRWLALLTLAIGFAMVSHASVKIGDLYYDLDSSDNTASVTYKIYSSYENNSYVKGDLVIPSTIEYQDTKYSPHRLATTLFMIVAA